MFSKMVKYKNFAGEDCYQEFYFHLGKAELLELGLAHITGRLERIKNTSDSSAILTEVRELVHMSAGVRSDDGKRFVKDADAKSALFDSGAWDELLFELATDAEAATEFVNKLFPQEMLAEMQKHANNNPAANEANKVINADAKVLKDEPKDDRPQWLKDKRVPTAEEFKAASKEHQMQAFLMKVG